MLAMPFLAAGCAGRPDPPLLEATAQVAEQECRLAVHGRDLPLAAVETDRRHWRGRSVHLLFGEGVPYRCVSAAVFALQRAGARDIAFISEWPQGARQ
jgi:hypothetical protein